MTVVQIDILMIDTCLIKYILSIKLNKNKKIYYQNLILNYLIYIYIIIDHVLYSVHFTPDFNLNFDHPK